MNNKEILLNLAALKMAAQGYSSLTMDTLLEISGIAKSNAYYHYPTKEVLGLSVLEYWCNVFQTFTENVLLSTLSPQKKIDLYFYRLVKFQQKTQYLGDPISFLSMEIQNPKSLELYSDFKDIIIELWTRLLQEGKRTKDFNSKISTESAALAIAELISSSLVQAKITQSHLPILQAYSQICSILKA